MNLLSSCFSAVSTVDSYQVVSVSAGGGSIPKEKRMYSNSLSIDLLFEPNNSLKEGKTGRKWK